MKTSALRRWLVSLGLIARDQTTRLTGGYDWEDLKETKMIRNSFKNQSVIEFVYKIVLVIK